MICHGISTGALFILVGGLQERIHTRDMHAMGGLFTVVPKMGAAGMIFALASLGLPGLGNFIAEFLVLAGSWRVDMGVTALASVGLVASTVYSLILFDRTFYGENERSWTLRDLDARDVAVFAMLAGAIIWLGIWPQPVLDAARPALDVVVRTVAGQG
jgi:NADH-quinone oxidoreductase subunit M